MKSTDKCSFCPNFVFCNQAVAASRIVVDYSDSSIPVNKKVFGVNLLGANDPAFMKTAKKNIIVILILAGVFGIQNGICLLLMLLVYLGMLVLQF